MKIAIIGVGAMGSVYAALLADVGRHEIIAIDSWQGHVDAINARGLRVEGASGDRTVKIHATSHANAVADKDVELVIIATKDDGVEAAAHAALKIAKPDAPILTIQNGLGSADRVAAIVGADRVIIGVVGGFGASMKAPGHAHHNGMEFLRLGEMSGPKSARLEAVAEAWRAGSFKVLTFDNIHTMIWEKLICNVAYSGPCALTGLRVAEIQADANAWSITKGCVTEAYAVAQKLGIALGFTDPVQYVKDFGQKIPNARPSMLLDHLAKRPAEVDNINGAICREGRRAGVPTPVNDTVVALLRVTEAGFKRAST
jgi:2-dehydropantoate 2-reductase